MPDTPHPAAVGAGLLDDLAFARAFRTGAGGLDHTDWRPLGHLDLACTAAFGTGFCGRTALGAAPAADIALFKPLDLNLLFAALGRFHERQPERHIDVVARIGPFGLRVRLLPPKPLKPPPKKLSKMSPTSKPPKPPPPYPAPPPP